MERKMKKKKTEKRTNMRLKNILDLTTAQGNH